MAAPKGLVSYGSSSSEEEASDETKRDHDIVANASNEDSHEPTKSIKHPHVTGDDEIPTKKARIPKLPSIPSAVLGMFSSEKHSDDPSQHDGRIRSFAHERGNWATYVYVPVQVSIQQTFYTLIGTCIQCLKMVAEFKAINEPHVSLSRTLILRHHWIDLFVQSLRENCSPLESFLFDLPDIEFYSNDEKTRTFLAFKARRGVKQLKQTVGRVDESLADFKLQKYYENPSFHMSVAWCLGDVTQRITDKVKVKLQDELDAFWQDHEGVGDLVASGLCCKTGNKLFSIPFS